MLRTCFDENPLTWVCEKKRERLKGLWFRAFHWSFSSDIMAVKGLIFNVRDNTTIIYEKTREE